MCTLACIFLVSLPDLSHRQIMLYVHMMIAFVGIPDLVVHDLKLIEQMRSERKLLAHLSASYFVKKSAAFGV